ncbi:hypothetical protein SISNIDRAFT_456847 [Sistotremastrum niveocremeum HHB9708]|uniref:Uncharacterized protein n=2 Tax=Sistotremastraceae TaxID=3402574 RepID=A0A164S8N4_9AGAM|nr:hypothetical protein SISNIDRAFT_456847 [Sistotremastrum niveocremeum HHB9708]KZT34477.1 hypothetical protein SISSUDRAFT_1052714 [Sistotremastrum suecicum HHB10207 ss-3]
MLLDSDALLTDVLLDAALVLYTVHPAVLACALFISLFVKRECHLLFFALQNSIKAC